MLLVWHYELYWTVLFTIIWAFLFFIHFVIPTYLVAVKLIVRHRKASRDDKKVIVGFFHPYCNAGGGGERVLWCAIRAMQFRYTNIKVVVYTGDIDAAPDEILSRAQQRFNISLNDPIEFVYLRRRRWIEASMYPIFTLLGQSIGSVILGLEALMAKSPDVFIDTMGYAFTLPFFKYLGGCKVACYVHYPTITREMLHTVTRRVLAHNNRRIVARSPFLTGAKILYYRWFAWMYGWVGGCADSIMVNSSWTEDHINQLWGCTLKTHRVYPPCDVDDLRKIQEIEDVRPDKDKDKDKDEDLNAEANLPKSKPPPAAKSFKPGSGLFKIVSVGQFRPEKDHPMQLRSMYALRQILPEDLWSKVHLVFIGSCRDDEDLARVKDMEDLAKHLALEDNVQFKVNVSYDELKTQLREATAGLHAMWNEHFGIGIVECMAAGLIMVAHGSGGPKSDIIEEAEGSRNGYLATDESEYATALATIILMPLREREKISKAARYLLLCGVDSDYIF